MSEREPNGFIDAMAAPTPGACDRLGCPVLHDDPANPIHPEDLTRDFHERTGRCLGGNPQAEIHAHCARIEQQHAEGDHHECLPVEDGQSPGIRVEYADRDALERRVERLEAQMRDQMIAMARVLALLAQR